MARKPFSLYLAVSLLAAGAAHGQSSAREDAGVPTPELRTSLDIADLAAGAAHGQSSAWEDAGVPPSELRTSLGVADPDRPLVVTRIMPNEAPVIDADLSDPVWQKAALIADFVQSVPDTGQPASEKMEVRLLYDASNLYISVYAYDNEPEGIVLPPMARDSNPGVGDFVRFFIDPFQTRRNAYFFDIGPSGGRAEGLIQNSQDSFTEWNTIWAARAQVVSDGWVAEVAIPFRDLSYDPDRSEWGFDVFRVIRRKIERDRWGSTSPSVNFPDISQQGSLAGFRDLDEGLGLDIQLFGTARYKHDWQTPERDAVSFTASGNIFYRVTPSLTATATVNPDFSDTPLDERQVNTTRFALFLPETRDFFLQDAATFEFGGYTFVDAPNARPFFSRNIGSINGVPVTILGGGKISGTVGPFGIGALSVMTNEKNGVGRQVLSAARVTAAITDHVTLGTVFTNGDPTGASENTVAGADIRYFDSNFSGMGKNLQTDVLYQRSFSDTRGDDHAFGGAFNYPNEPWGGTLRFKQVGENFFPALGFVNRAGIREYLGEVEHTTRSATAIFRWLRFGGRSYFVTDLHDRLQSREYEGRVTLFGADASQNEIRVINYTENVRTAFNLPGGIPVPASSYNWTNIQGRYESLRSRPFSFILSAACCRYYNGRYFRGDLTLRFRFSDYLQINPRYVGTYLRMPNGDVDIHVLSLDSVLNFTPDMELALQAQYDNISRAFGLSMRYLWEYEPGQEIFAAFGQSGTVPGTAFPGDTFIPLTSQFSVRLGTTLRY